MLSMALGTIEVYGLPAAVEAADVACKTADVRLIGYETTDGMGMVTVKIEGQVSAVRSAIDAAKAAVERVTKVFATSVIPRPQEQLETVVLTDVTVGLESPKQESAEAPKNQAADKSGKQGDSNSPKSSTKAVSQKNEHQPRREKDSTQQSSSQQENNKPDTK